jgi:DNA polymerase-3 subunit epsilon
MGDINKEVFVCLDCELTGLDPEQDRIIEVAAVRFTMDSKQAEFETLINPEIVIPEASIVFHHITQDMVENKPLFKDILQDLMEVVGRNIIIGHGINFDIQMIANAAARCGLPCNIKNNRSIDTLRMARFYGESPINSLEQLRKHFNITEEGAHRAMSDVVVNIEVFKYLAKKFRTTEQIFDALSRPILFKIMPLGKHKGRPVKEIPIEYLLWAARQEYDQDLLFTLRTEIKRRKGGNLFTQASNPFSNL